MKHPSAKRMSSSHQAILHQTERTGRPWNMEKTPIKQHSKKQKKHPLNVNNLEVATGLAGVLLEHAFWTKQQIEWTSLRESPYKNYDIFPSIHQHFLDASSRSQATPLLPSCTLAVASPTPLAAFVAFAHWNIAAAVAAPTSPEMKPPASSRWQVTSLMLCTVPEVRIMCQRSVLLLFCQKDLWNCEK